MFISLGTKRTIKQHWKEAQKKLNVPPPPKDVVIISSSSSDDPAIRVYQFEEGEAKELDPNSQKPPKPSSSFKQPSPRSPNPERISQKVPFMNKKYSSLSEAGQARLNKVKLETKCVPSAFKFHLLTFCVYLPGFLSQNL